MSSKIILLLPLLLVLHLHCAGDSGDNLPTGSTAEKTAITCLVPTTAEIMMVKITLPAHASDKGGTYWIFDTPDSEYYVWYNTGSSSNPSPSGRTGIQVSLDVSNTANEVATNTYDAMNYLSDKTYSVTNMDDYIIITAYSSGYADLPQDETTGISLSDTITGKDAISGKTPAQLGGTGFALHTPTEDFHVWYDYNNGSNDPLSGTGTGYEVDVADGQDAYLVAENTENAMAPLVTAGKFAVARTGNVITFTAVDTGTATDAADSGTGFTITVTQQGSD